MLEVAAREFLRRGYVATSLERVAETAGFSKGAVYGNFAGKEDLCLAVLDQHYTARFHELSGELASAPATAAARIEAFERWSEKIIGDHDWRLLAFELSMQARQDRTLRRKLAARDRTVRSAIAALVGRQFDELGVAPVLPPDQLAVVIVAVAGGVALQRAVDPEIPASLVGDTLRVLFAARPNE